MPFDLRGLLEHLLQHADQISALVFFWAMFAGSLFEYVFPPVPGDLWTAAGAILIARGQKFITIFLAVNLGAAVGFTIDYAFGAWLSSPRRRFRAWGPRWERLGSALDRIAKGFERHTELYLVVNRFLPGIRALFFVAAGFARVPLWKVLTFGIASSLAWNLILIGGGFAVGKNFDLLARWLDRYTWAAWAVVISAVLLVLARLFLRRRRQGG